VRNSILEIQNVSKKFSKNFTESIPSNLKNIFSAKHRTELEPHEFWSLNDVSLSVGTGELVGIIGPNGSGKTTLMRIVSGIYRQDIGTVKTNGRIAAIFALKSGMHPHLTGRENIFVKASLYGLTKNETESKVESIIEFSGLRDFMERPFGVYSAGMKAKLAFAILTAVEPQLFIIDEGLAVGDKIYQEKCFQYLKDQKDKITTIYITNQHEHLINFADRIIVMHKGTIIGDTNSYEEAESIYESTKSI
jgi:lipopolysaccharide transport system ATP-binding protein